MVSLIISSIILPTTLVGNFVVMLYFLSYELEICLPVSILWVVCLLLEMC